MIDLWTARCLPKPLELCEEECFSCLLMRLHLLLKSCHLLLESVLIVDEGEIHLINTANNELDYLIYPILVLGVFPKISIILGYGIREVVIIDS